MHLNIATRKIAEGLAVIFLLVGLVTASSGCGDSAKGEDAHDFYAVGYDKTGSTKRSQTSVNKDYDLRLINTFPEGSTIVTAIIGRDPLSGGKQDAFKVTLPTKAFSDIQLRFDEKLNNEKEELRKKSIELFDKAPVSDRSDILDTIRLLSEFLPQDRSGKMEMVLFTDGMETGRVNFYTTNLTEEKITQIIQAEKDAGRLPNLNGVEVRMIGAGKGDESMPVEARDRVRALWSRYFAECGGELVEFGPSPEAF